MSVIPNSYGVLVGSAKEGASIAGFHKIVTLQRCETEYKYAEVLHLKQKNEQQNAAFQLGGLVHWARAHWFATQCTGALDDTLHAMVNYIKESGDPIKITAEQKAVQMFQAYHKHWNVRPKPLVRAVEYPLGPAPLKENDPFFLYRTARLDDVCTYPDVPGVVCIGDLKTTSDTISGTMNEYRMHGQFMTYAILWKMAKEGQATFGPSPGIMIDIMTKDEEPKFHRELITVTEYQQRWWYETMAHLLRRAPAIQDSTPTLRNTTQCARSISRRGSYLCPYHKLCQYGSSAAGQYVDEKGELFSERSELVE